VYAIRPYTVRWAYVLAEERRLVVLHTPRLDETTGSGVGRDADGAQRHAHDQTAHGSVAHAEAVV